VSGARCPNRLRVPISSIQGLTEEGVRRIDWAWALSEMHVLQTLMERFVHGKPLEAVRISGCLHITTETANLARVLAAGGANLVLCASNPLSTQDDVAAALAVHFRIPVFARRGDDNEADYRHIASALDRGPQITLDDGADLVSKVHNRRHELIDTIFWAERRKPRPASFASAPWQTRERFNIQLSP